MKIVVKGVLTVDDALASVRHRVDGIWVSNHGARQLDTTPATIEVLPEIVKAVAGRCEGELTIVNVDKLINSL